MMEILRIAAFSYGETGGNPAGVAFVNAFPSDSEMLQTAKNVGYSETAFLMPVNGAWKIRYFAPEIEISFCGHATIASGAALAGRFGDGKYELYLNDGPITVTASKTVSGRYSVALQSPETSSLTAPPDYIEAVLAQFNFSADAVHSDFSVRFASAGARHLIIFVTDHGTLQNMDYEFDAIKRLMLDEGLATINLLWPESSERFHSRNPFASGGVFEDPATGAAAAALAGYLRDIGWKRGNRLEIIQGEDMGSPCRLIATFTAEPGASVVVAGETRQL